MAKRSTKGDNQLPEADENELGSEGNLQTETGIITRTMPLNMKIIVCIIVGFIFGFMMEKGQVFDPRMIRQQMVMKKFVMLKMFLSAVASGMFGLSLMAMWNRTHRTFMYVCTDYYNSIADKGVTAALLGGSLMGVGVTLSGSCPTSIFTQVGALVPNAGYTLAGALAGTLLYALIKPVVDMLTRTSITESSNPWNNSPYFVMALPLVAMFGVLVAAFEILFPWNIDAKPGKTANAMFLQRKVWPPYVSGAVIGLLQVPLVLFVGESLGGSSSLLTVLSQLFVGPLKKLSPFICKYKRGFGSWWQICYVGGTILGAFVAAWLSGTLGSVKGVPALHGFIGGMLMLLGARIAGGCTSGHGISGMGFLSIVSFLTIATLFSVAMATAVIMRYFGMLRIK